MAIALTGFSFTQQTAKPLPFLRPQVMSFYIHVFVFIGVNIVLQLFVGIVVNNYNEHKPNHSALLTVSQKRWSDLVERIALTRPIKKPPEPRK